jgi:hypothetical protein
VEAHGLAVCPRECWMGGLGLLGCQSVPQAGRAGESLCGKGGLFVWGGNMWEQMFETGRNVSCKI